MHLKGIYILCFMGASVRAYIRFQCGLAAMVNCPKETNVPRHGVQVIKLNKHTILSNVNFCLNISLVLYSIFNLL